MLTYFPYGIAGCHITKSVIINRYDEHKLEWEHENYFPEKLKNFYGCKWMWATQEDMPYSAFERDVNKNIVAYKGIEGQLFNFMSRNLNFSIEVQEVNFNKVLDGAQYAEMLLQYPEYVFGGLHYKADLWRNATFSQSFNFFLSHFFVVTNLPSFDSSIEKLLFAFQTSAWLLIGTCYILASIFIFIYGNLNAKWREVVMGHRNTVPHYNLFVIAMGSSSVAAVPRRNFARFLLIIWLLATLVLRSIYQARMYQMLRDKTFHNPPKTIADALSGDYVLQTIPSTNAVFRNLPTPKQQVFLNETEKNILIAMGYSQEPKALVTAYEYYGYIRKMNLINHRLHLVKQRILTKQLVYFVRKNSHLLFEINMQILTAQTYGFMDKWIREIVQYDRILGSPKTSASKENAKNFVIERTANVLALQELEAVFIALVLLHGCSIVVFILEIYLFRN
ncbi:uncharacterized protein LOC119665154 [Teleopsis dalmanni]|uniref:uncharacterized protein LOC119665154 n=1 Tax=Teleopsis dalmanni TaxID=139649 RepID=UPI0018CE1AE6|nr:uncharacterized protein LOC119665154 [Teleopsis dalmanni]